MTIQYAQKQSILGSKNGLKRIRIVHIAQIDTYEIRNLFVFRGDKNLIIQKINNYLWVKSNIYFDNECCFCGRPYISLTAHKDKDKFWDANTITIAIHDMDDFDYGLLYKTKSGDFINVLHELINWMRDHEQGISIYDDILDIFEFFPDCGCEREVW